jgi:hypothetical protein
MAAREAQEKLIEITLENIANPKRVAGTDLGSARYELSVALIALGTEIERVNDPRLTRAWHDMHKPILHMNEASAALEKEHLRRSAPQS